MNYHLLSGKPWPKLMQIYCELDPQEHSSVKLKSNYEKFYAQKWF